MKRFFYIIILIGTQSFGQMIMSAEGVSTDNVCNPNNIHFPGIRFDDIWEYTLEIN